MIISASRRTDLPSFYSDWFFNRIKEGYVLVPNPFNSKILSRISLRPEIVDCIVFWTKNPAPMLSKLKLLKDYKYYFQFTLNPYGRDIESHLPPLMKRLDTFRQLSDDIGKERVIWRYDPVFISKKYDITFHQEAFARIAENLKDHTEKCILGFIDHYPHLRNILLKNGINLLSREEIGKIATSFKITIDQHPGIEINTCTNKVDLAFMDIPAGQCIDKDLISRITGYPIIAQKDKNQRNLCNCVESIDIGTYNCCLNGCLYCYANKSNSLTSINNKEKHNPASPLMTGQIKEDQIIREREMKSLRNNQFSLF